MLGLVPNFFSIYGSNGVAPALNTTAFSLYLSPIYLATVPPNEWPVKLIS